jgi:serine/threonine-protein kinase
MERIGRYRIVSEIGHGGMGAVYLAERDDDFHQRVAIKVVRGVLGEHGLRRFRAERQILASLNHPCIAQLIDGGTTAEGLPYLVMEYVDGVALNTYCDAHALTTGQRLALFCRIADAVSHAHRSLVVHRDLKPSNILVTADGTPKLLDFGIAKLLDASDDATLLTAPSMQLLTPEYASPEQVRNAPITTSTDIYSLGVVLYELVAHRRPYRLISKLREELEYVVCQQDPPRPGIAADLDTIVLHAMEKDPAPRYASVDHFVEDIRAVSRGRPIQARPSTWRYRSARFVRRHRVGVATAAIFTIVVIGFAIALGFTAARAARERNTSDRVTALLVELFSGSSQSARGENVTASELLQQGTERVRRELADRPDLQARVLDAIGSIYIGLGLPEKAQSVLKKSADARSSAGAMDSLDRARTLSLLAETLRERRQFAAAEPLAREAVAMGRRVIGRKSPQVAQWGNTLGLIEHELGKRAEAEALFVENAQIFRDTLGPEHPMVGTSLLNLSMSLRARGDFAGAEMRAREALAIHRYTFGSATADSLREVAAGVEGQGRLREAEELLREEVAIRRQTYGPAGHPSLTSAMQRLADVLRAEGQSASSNR